MNQDPLKTLLKKFNLEHCLAKFKEQHIIIETLAYITEKDFGKLGVETIGDRARLREESRLMLGNPQSTSRATSILQERNIIFSPRGQNARQRGKKRKVDSGGKKQQPWTANFVCLSNRFTNKVPGGQEKIVLAKAGLGFKKIKLDLEDDEETVIEKLKSAELLDSSNDETKGFPKLSEAGGFELLRCIANCKDLESIDCALTARAIKSANGGGQGELYIRPIQHSLSTVPLISETSSSSIRQKCKVCSKSILQTDLRKHLKECASLDSDNEENYEYSPFDWAGSSSARVTNQLDIRGLLAERSQLAEQGTLPSHNNLSSASEPAHVSESTPIEPETTTEPQTTTGDETTSESVTTPERETATDLETTPTNSAENPDRISSDDDDDYEATVETRIKKILKDCKAKKIDPNPVEVLRCMQKHLVNGRPLEVKDPSICTNGQVNLIMADRERLLTTG